jgi:Dolichyl-phosphate-mannose-protein mannosyltransferase
VDPAVERNRPPLMSSAASGSLRRRDLVVLGAILLAALAVRLAYLLPLLRDPAFDLVDPDRYLYGGEMLARGGFRWTFDIVRYEYAGRSFYLPPLYPVFLSLFSVFADTARAALVGQAILNVIGVALLFELGRRVHSTRAGLMAAAIYAVWFPNVIASWFSQETLYIPLVILAFVLCSRAVSRGDLLSFALAGAALGLAAMTRSMPLYLLLPLAVTHVVLAPPPRAVAVRHSLAMILGFVLVTAPYSLALSRHVGELTVIENHAGIELLTKDEQADESTGLDETARAFLRALDRRRDHLLADSYDSIRSLLHLNGGRLLQHYIVAEDRERAVLWKAAAHIFSDLALAATLVLAPFGLVLARERETSVVSALWILLNVALVALGGFAGARLRSPFEPHLILFAAVVLSGGFGRLRVGWLSAAALLSASLFPILVPQIPRTLHAWPDYGVRWQERPKGWRTLVRGSAGLNFRVDRGGVSMELRARGEPDDPVKTVVEIRIDGESMGRELFSPHERRELVYPWPEGTLAFVELDASSPETGEPQELLLVARPR